ncbi:MAG: hypothetical protein ACR2HJ_13190 [Fimbriimonadales bacterium]
MSPRRTFRTWAGAEAVGEIGPGELDREAKSNVVRAIEIVAERLGNTMAVYRKCYIHLNVLYAYLSGSTAKGENGVLRLLAR